MDTTEQPRLAPPLLQGRLASPLPEAAWYALPAFGQLVRLSAALAVFVAVFGLTGRSEHPLTAMGPGPFVTFVSLAVPGAAALVAAFALYRPWRALLLVLALAPLWNSAYVSLQIGPVQVILQTVFVFTLAIGTLTTRPNTGAFPWSASDLVAAGRSRGFAAFRFAEVAVAGLIGLAVVSTMASSNVTLSATVLLHGILEPIALAAILVALRPSRRDLVMVGLALGISMGLGTAFNLAQTLPIFTSLASVDAHRLTFARASFYNVGLFAAIVAMTIPLIVAVLASRRSLSLPRWATVLMIVTLAAGLLGLFFSLSKSAWIAAGVGTVLVLLLMVQSWRRRLTLVLAATALSTLFIPWPALFLQVVPSANSGYRTVMVALVGESRFDSWNPATIAGRGSLVERFYAVDAGVKMAVANPILGVGLDQFGPNYNGSTKYRPAQALDTLDHAHSLFPEIAAELGIPALALVLVIYGATLWALWRAHRNARDQLTRFLAAGLMAAIVAWLVVASAFGCDFYRPSVDLSSDVVVSCVLVGAAIALARTVRAEKPPQPSSPSRAALS
ncbi:MAG: O-antigen ligase family protein [Candidatus Limnocylindrales bacterium]